ncbi:hypothetical protein BDZ91DRAFT_709372 [Kalaharituber pfeilii]|nr:hypothetical protein BDZ91DRAFT_709372 [Kalaharituber pfeilii]
MSVFIGWIIRLTLLVELLVLPIMSAELNSCPGILHEYATRLTAFEHLPGIDTTSTTADTQSLNTLLFVGGLGDYILSPAYVHQSIVPAIYGDKKLRQQWRVVEVAITSSGKGWGTGSVKRDAEELALCVKFFKELRPNGKIVLMGHSTGCQDTFHLITKLSPTPPLAGIILQAPVSDREALTPYPVTKTLLTIATSLINTPPSPDRPLAPRGKSILPIELTSQIFGLETPISAQRWYSLTAPPDNTTGFPVGDEDFFSSDIPERYVYDHTFGAIPSDSVKVLVLYSEEDQWVPAEIDKEALVKRWVKVMEEKGVRVDKERSGVIEEATHDLSNVDESVLQDVVSRVKGFLEWVGEDKCEVKE